MLKAPFPYFGGKRRLAGKVWDRLGDPMVYAEPFLGSAAVLLARPGFARCRTLRELVCDRNGLVVNFWRAVKLDPEGVAAHVDNPLFQPDLTAWNRKLIEWADGNADRLSNDVDYHDVEAAGRWAWGQIIFLGAGWCARTASGGVGDKRTKPRPGGLLSKNVMSGERTIIGEITRLHERFRDVVVVSSSWENCVTPAFIDGGENIRGRKVSVGVFLDPPYRRDTRVDNIYATDRAEKESARCVATESYEWAVENGNTYRIAYCCQVDDFPVPEGWTFETGPMIGHRKDRSERTDMVMFSPTCVPVMDSIV